MADNIQSIFGMANVVISTLYRTGVPVLPFPDPSLIMGIELEIENTENIRAPRLFRETDDGSLRNNGREYISFPSEYPTLYRGLNMFFTNNQLAEVKQLDGMYSPESNYSDRTSIHVHTNVQDLTLEQVATLCLLYQVFERTLFDYVGGERDKNIFCVPWCETMIGRRTVQLIKSGYHDKIYEWHKYTALNLSPIQNQGTVEWRHMPGTNDLKKIDGWLRIIGSLYAAVRAEPFDYWLNVLISLNSNSQYERVFSNIFGKIPAFNFRDYRPQIEAGVLDLKFDWY